jgi:hypothetical protein
MAVDLISGGTTRHRRSAADSFLRNGFVQNQTQALLNYTHAHIFRNYFHTYLPPSYTVDSSPTVLLPQSNLSGFPISGSNVRRFHQRNDSWLQRHINPITQGFSGSETSGFIPIPIHPIGTQKKREGKIWIT